VAQECSSNKRAMNLPASDQIDARKSAIHRYSERWNMNLRQVNVSRVTPVNTRNLPPVYKRQLQLGCEERINTALLCAGVYQSSDINDTCNGNPGWICYGIVARVKAYVYK